MLAPSLVSVAVSLEQSPRVLMIVRVCRWTRCVLSSRRVACLVLLRWRRANAAVVIEGLRLEPSAH